MHFALLYMSDIRVLEEAWHSLVIDFEDHILLKLSSFIHVS